METAVEIKPIALFRSRKQSPFEAARQATADTSTDIGEIHFFKNENFEQALEGIESFSHLWLVYQFHHNRHWKPKVLPPRGSERKIGVFATRSPYRPNALGLSAVRLLGRQGLILKISQFDLLDETPIFDVKPYLPYADSLPEANLGWLAEIENERHQVFLEPQPERALQFLETQGLGEFRNFILTQLEFEPLNFRKKRVQILQDSQGILAYRTWRVTFVISEKIIRVMNLFSGYSNEEISDPADPFSDKDLHRRFLQTFP
jgi:tRNA-Thr(GGU) m(6)t(6)A37 methyltransferase TsaA